MKNNILEQLLEFKMATNNGIVVNALRFIQCKKNGMLTKSNDVTIYTVISV